MAGSFVFGSISPTTEPISPGWATQAGQRTVAGVLEEALSTVFRSAGAVARGRTHRHRRACHRSGRPRRRSRSTRCPTPIRVRRGRTNPEFLPLVRRLGRLLPADVRVREIVRAPAGFDARFSALRRHYVYRLSTAAYGVEPHQARYITAGRGTLDVDAMAAASRDLLGLHDFAAFCRHREGATTIRDLQRLDWAARRRSDHRARHRRRVLLVDGAIAGRRAAGRRRASAHRRRGARELLTDTRRSSDFAAAPARGLTLVGVDYPPDSELQARTLITRDLRTRD